MLAYRNRLPYLDWQTDCSGLSCERQEWLFYPASLTEKLKQHCRQFRVEVLAESWIENHTIWRREVCLYGDDVPWIFAQTDVPADTVAQVAQPLPHLGDQPVGLWLFPQNPVRQTLEWAQDFESGCYARRSTLLLRDYPLQITELFLPDFPFFAK